MAGFAYDGEQVRHLPPTGEFLTRAIPLSSERDLSERVTTLEMLVMHLQHDLEQLNSVVLRQQTELQSLQRMFGRLEARFDRFEPHEDRRDPLEERPPHY